MPEKNEKIQEFRSADIAWIIETSSPEGLKNIAKMAVDTFVAVAKLPPGQARDEALDDASLTVADVLKAIAERGDKK